MARLFGTCRRCRLPLVVPLFLHTCHGRKESNVATKHNCPCLEKAADDEPIFVLRAQDRCAPAAIRAWVHRAIGAGAPLAKTEAAMACAAEMEKWQAEHSAQAKFPD